MATTSLGNSSSDEIVIVIDGLGKSYRLFDRPQDRLKHAIMWRFGKPVGREFWALHDITFQVRRGEAVGIVGRNGAGKSTLLQTIAGTVSPTMGQAQVKGRVTALLELGSGFNPEFTGRENVLLNGAILGITQDEMEECFDEILSFADIDGFIDQPVKSYSSGMVLRLAFAVQAVIKKDILIVDEALAVGDEAFQRKCMRTLEQFRNNGGTVLLVSHSTQAIVRQCDRCIFLENGQLVLDGPSKPVTDVYQNFVLSTPLQQQEILALLRTHSSTPIEKLLQVVSRKKEMVTTTKPSKLSSAHDGWDPHIPSTIEMVYGGGQAEIYEFGMYNTAEQLVNVLIAGEKYIWRYKVRFFETAYEVSFGMMLKTIDGIEVAGSNNLSEGIYIDKINADTDVEVSFQLRMNVGEGVYYLNSGVMGVVGDTNKKSFLHRRVDICAMRVLPPDAQQIHGLAYLAPGFSLRYIRS